MVHCLQVALHLAVNSLTASLPFPFTRAPFGECYPTCNRSLIRASSRSRCRHSSPPDRDDEPRRRQEILVKLAVMPVITALLVMTTAIVRDAFNQIRVSHWPWVVVSSANDDCAVRHPEKNRQAQRVKPSFARQVT